MTLVTAYFDSPDDSTAAQRNVVLTAEKSMMALTPMDKLIEVTQAADKVWSNPPAGLKPFAHYAFQSNPFPGFFDPDKGTSAIVLVEAESNEAITAAIVPIAAAGCTIACVPVVDLLLAGIAEAPKKYGA